ncbi:MAG: peptide-N-glycosidase [Candidatus Marinimicrobia bacterium]|nr:peptide-N-glycosidase [Candidatus Neomarinimicrobiota bacterium]
MKKIVLTIWILFSIGYATEKVATVRAHDSLINTDPSKGVKSFIKWAQFPSRHESIRRMKMNVTLAYPADRAIAHWDYRDHIKILRSGGMKGQNFNYEIGRMLTPYGSNFKEGWSYTWQVDVTDFQYFLRDSVEIEYIHSGYESPELGWDLTIDFDIEYGPEIATFISMERLWEDNFQYGNPENDIESNLKPIQIKTAPGSVFGRIRIQHTGHGMDSLRGCSEFCRRWREIILDGMVIDHRDIWKECGNNPLYPQGGTWIFDRGNWCPGDLQNPDIIDFPFTKPNHILDLSMEPYRAHDVNQPYEQIAAYLFQFSAPTHRYDVAVESIIAPNKSDPYNRYNPAGFNSKIKIKNLGAELLESLVVTYQTEGFKPHKYNWKGNLAFNQETEIVLPGIIEAREGENRFTVTLSKPNGKKDQWKPDNTLSSIFFSVPTLPTQFIVDFLTNNKPRENSLWIINSDLDTVFYKAPETLDSATRYQDTLLLPEGYYALALTDTAGDGLEFWFMANAGYGYLRLKDLKGNIIKLFESDCGNGQFFAFQTRNHAVVDTTNEYFSINIFPRMVSDDLKLYVLVHQPSTIKTRITKDGRFIEEHIYSNIKDSAIGMDCSHLEEGRYVMEIYLNDEPKMNRRFNKIK